MTLRRHQCRRGFTAKVHLCWTHRAEAIESFHRLNRRSSLLASGWVRSQAIALVNLELIFADVLHDLEPMLAVLQSFGYDALVCSSAILRI